MCFNLTFAPFAGNEDEWHAWKEVGDPVLHIELRRWADCLLIAPLSANTLAKIAQGFCDNLLTCVVRVAFLLLCLLYLCSLSLPDMFQCLARSGLGTLESLFWSHQQ